MRHFPLVAILIAVAAASPMGRGTWQGLVFDATGAPVAQAHVQAGDIMKPSAGMLYQAYSDANGRFIIRGAPAGATTVEFWAGKPESFFPDFPGPFYTDRPPTLIRTSAGGSARGVHVYLAPQCGRIAGKVFDDKGRPVAPQISMWRYGKSEAYFGTAGWLDGHFQVLVPAVPIIVYIHAPGHEPWFYPGTRQPGRARPLTVEPRVTVDLGKIILHGADSNQ